MADDTEKVEVDESQQIEEKGAEELTSFADDLAAAFEEADKAVEEEVAAAEEEKPEKGDVKAEEDSGKAEDEAVDKGEDKGEDISASEKGADDSSKDAEIDCTPFCRTEEERASFAKLPFEAQRVVEQRYKDFEAGFQDKVKGNADELEYAEEIRKAFQPYEAMILAEGGSHTGAIQNLLTTSYILKNGTPEQKRQLMNQMVKTYSIDLDAIEQGDDAYVDPQIQELRDQTNSLNAQLTQMQTAAVNTEDQAALTEVNAFISEIDDKGQLTHPHFKTVAPQIKALLDGKIAKSLPEAYDQALWLNPDTAKLMRDDLIGQNPNKQTDDEKAKLEAAKKAKGISPAGGASEVKQADAKDMTLEEELGRNWDTAEAS